MDGPLWSLSSPSQRKKDPVSFWCLYKSHGGILISACASRDLLLNKGDGDGEVGVEGNNRLPLKLLAQTGPCENR